ncbi:MAG TPA: winged helix DNA-binding domain-containing protein [Rubrobacter sp.]|nr:winged helix DNA-binding domain-containing protein [Rubrobacter sp.]
MIETDVVGQRLVNQRIEAKKFEKPEEVVRCLGAIQAQDYSQSLWAIGLRLKSATVADIEKAISEGRIVRTWPMRGTLHFVPPEDAKWMLKLSASRMLAKDGRRLAQLGLDQEVMERCTEIFYDALKGNKRLSRPHMMRLVEEAGISTENQRGYHILWYVAQSGLICLGPMKDKQQTFVLLDELAPDSRNLSREESLAELTKRYFASHGPATVHDFAWWAGLTVTESRAGLEAAKPELLSESIDGKEYWMTGDAPDARAYDTSGVNLLPGFDEYLLGYKDRSAVLAEQHAPEVVPGRNGVFRPIIVAGGRVVGTWKRRLKKDAVDLTLSPFTHPDRLRQRTIEAAISYSNFVGLPLSATEIEAGRNQELK